VKNVQKKEEAAEEQKDKGTKNLAACHTQQVASHGDSFRIFWTANGMVRIILNKMNIEYKNK